MSNGTITLVLQVHVFIALFPHSCCLALGRCTVKLSFHLPLRPTIISCNSPYNNTMSDGAVTLLLMLLLMLHRYISLQLCL